MKLNIYFSNYEVNSFLFEDYGETFAYEQDIYLEKKFVVIGTSTNLCIQQSMEGLYTPRYENYKINVIGLPFKPSKIFVDEGASKDFVINNGNLEFTVRKNFKVLKIAR